MIHSNKLQMLISFKGYREQNFKMFRLISGPKNKIKTKQCIIYIHHFFNMKGVTGCSCTVYVSYLGELIFKQVSTMKKLAEGDESSIHRVIEDLQKIGGIVLNKDNIRYSQTFIKRTHLGQRKSCLGQVTSQKRLNSFI